LEIELQCPQCNAPVSLDETDRLFTCSYCRARLFPYGGDYLRYYLPHPPQGPAASKEVFYVPYWRARGMLFSCVPFDVTPRLVDITLPASDRRGLPESLGLRTQTLKLRFVNPAMSGRLVPVALPYSRIHSNPEDLFVPSEGGIHAFHHVFVGETVSLVYTPVYCEAGRIYDAVLARPVGPDPGTLTVQEASAEQADGELRFLPALCPNCGGDLAAKRQSCVFLCGRCNSAWGLATGEMAPVDFAVMPDKRDSDRETLYLPFWRMDVSFDGVGLRSFADLVRFANLPRAVRPEWEEQEISFWLPAFRLAPQLFLRVSRQITIGQPGGETEAQLPEASFHPATVTLAEAIQAITPLVAVLAARKKEVYPLLSTLAPRCRQARLVLLPFHASPGDYVFPGLPCAIPRQALQKGG
jgi:ribosomal protein S27AE